MNYSRAIFIVICLFGLIFSVLGYQITETLEGRHSKAEQERITQQIKDVLLRVILVNQNHLDGIERLFLASTFVDRDEFRIYVEGFLKKEKSLQALEWIPYVPAAKRAEYESNARKDGLEGFQIREKDNSGKMVPAASRPEYYPVFYLEPLAGNEAALGFDLGSNVSRRETLERSRESGTMQATASITLVQEKGNQKGFLIFAPVFKSSSQSGDDSAKSFMGFSLGVFRVKDLIGTVLRQAEEKANLLNLQVIDVSDKSKPDIMFARELDNLADVEVNPDWQLSKELEFAGRKWKVTSVATEEFLQLHYDATPWFVFSTGILLTLLLAAYLYQISSREKSIKNQVDLRTQELAISRSRNKSIIANAVNAIITINAKGRVSLFNPAAEKMFGYSSEEVLGQNVKMLMPEPYQSQHDTYLENYHTTGERKIIGIGREVVGRKKDGTEFDINLTVGEAHFGGVRSYVGVITDLSEQKRIQDDLREAKELAEQANKHKSAFLNVMSHELRTPLTVILGYLPMLKNMERMPSPDSIVQIAQDMDVTGQHLLELINDLLDISKIEAGQMALHPELVQVREVVEDMHKRFGAQADKKGLVLQTESEDMELMLDVRRLRQILINLVGNSIKFTQEGKISVSAEYDGESDGARFTVFDTGMGIPGTDLPYIFDSFRQVDDSSTRKIGGSGLGLAITRKLVELHGGKISVESRHGEWTKFTFTITQVNEEGEVDG